MDDAEKVLERLQTSKRRQIEIHEIYEKELLEITNSGGSDAIGVTAGANPMALLLDLQDCTDLVRSSTANMKLHRQIQIIRKKAII